MRFIRKHKGKITALICVLFVLVVAFFWGGSNTEKSVNKKSSIVSSIKKEPAKTPDIQENTSAEDVIITPEPSVVPESTQEVVQEENIEYIEEKEIAEEIYNIEPVSDCISVSEEIKETNGELVCTMSVRCDNAVGKVDEKYIVIPKDGVIFKEQTVVFYEGESVFDVLVREMKKNKIHLEFVNIPVYNSAYIEGINNLYEFDCGELSGWMYKVNDVYPNYGCSQYKLKNGDKISWVYTCDLGKDVGGEYSARNGMQ